MSDCHIVLLHYIPCWLLSVYMNLLLPPLPACLTSVNGFWILVYSSSILFACLEFSM